MKRGVLSSGLLLIVSTGALAVAEPESVSLQDLKPECKERHTTLAPEQCMIQDGVILRQYARRFTEPILIMPPPPPATTERQSPAPAAPPAVIQIVPATR